MLNKLKKFLFSGACLKEAIMAGLMLVFAPQTHILMGLGIAYAVMIS